MKVKTLIIVIVTLFLLVPSLNALSLSGMKLSPIIFRPGLNISNHYTITDTDKEVNVKVGGDLEEYIHITEVVNNEFDLIINFPQYITPGKYRFGLTAEEIPSGSDGGIGSLISVSKQFVVEVYTFDKYIDISLDAPSVNEGTPVNFRLSVSSKGYQDIDSIKGEITVSNGGNDTIGKVSTEEKSLNALAYETLTAVFETKGLPAGEYSAEGVVFYDGEQKTAKTNFRVGQMDLVLKNYTSEVKKGFSDYTMTVVNNWGNELGNVYAKLFVEGKELLHTPTILLKPWEEGNLKGIIKVDKEPGIYPAEIELFFEGESRKEQVELKVVEEEEGSSFLIPVILLIIAVLLAGAVLLLKKKIKNSIAPRGGV